MTGGKRKTKEPSAARRKSAGQDAPDGQAREKPLAQSDRRRTIERTADGHHVLIDGRRWRATDPRLPEERRQELVAELRRARRDVGRAMRAGEREAELDARRRVHECKVALGERGAKWWEEKKDDGGQDVG